MSRKEELGALALCSCPPHVSRHDGTLLMEVSKQKQVEKGSESSTRAAPAFPLKACFLFLFRSREEKTLTQCASFHFSLSAVPHHDFTPHALPFDSPTAATPATRARGICPLPPSAQTMFSCAALLPSILLVLQGRHHIHTRRESKLHRRARVGAERYGAG